MKKNSYAWEFKREYMLMKVAIVTVNIRYASRSETLPEARGLLLVRSVAIAADVCLRSDKKGGTEV